MVRCWQKLIPKKFCCQIQIGDIKLKATPAYRILKGSLPPFHGPATIFPVHRFWLVLGRSSSGRSTVLRDVMEEDEDSHRQHSERNYVCYIGQDFLSSGCMKHIVHNADYVARITLFSCLSTCRPNGHELHEPLLLNMWLKELKPEDFVSIWSW